MVKFKDDKGRPVFLAPEHVVSIQPKNNDAESLVWNVANKFHVIPASPDEVHAKLFPPLTASSLSVLRSAEESTERVRMVLEWVASEDGALAAPPALVIFARGALGREAT